MLPLTRCACPYAHLPKRPCKGNNDEYASALSPARCATEFRTTELIGARMHASYVVQSMWRVLVSHCVRNKHTATHVLQRPWPGPYLAHALVCSRASAQNMYMHRVHAIMVVACAMLPDSTP